MRILLAIHNAYTDSTSGAAHSVRTLMQWLAEAGHTCRVLATARFDGKPPEDLNAHLASLGVPLQRQPAPKAFLRGVHKPRNVLGGRPSVAFTLHGVPVSMLLTRHHLAERPAATESAQYLYMLDRLLEQFAPDILLTYGAHPVVQESLQRAQRRGVITLLTLRNRGYEHRRWFAHVDHVLTCSPYLSEYYRECIGLISTGIASPIDWSQVVAPTESRAFVTFVNPLWTKGAAVFARLADMLGSRRPDIPMLVIQSAAGAGYLNDIAEIDFTRYPQIMAAPPVPRPADFFALTKLLLVPTLVPEPFGRVAVEAMINGIPPLVSARGALPQTVAGAGRVLPLPDWLTGMDFQLPSRDELEPWFATICELWDNAQAYDAAAVLARQTAQRLYSEAALRQQHLAYITSLQPGGRLFQHGEAAPHTSCPRV